MAWAKLHTDVLGDVKLMRATRKGAKNLVLLPWLIAFAKAADDGGRLSVGGIPAEPDDIAPLIPDTKSTQVAACCAGLQEIGVLERDPDGAYRFAQWSKRADAYPSDEPEAVRERVRQHRAKQREQSLHVTNGNESAKRGALAREVEEEESREEVEKEKRGKSPRRNERSDPWVRTLTALWSKHVGLIAPVKIRKALAGLVAEYGAEKVEAALAVYVSPDEGPPPDKARRPDWFAENFHRWRQIAEQPLNDKDGVLTERGRRLMARPA